MATNHTTNYNLNLWEASDKFVREEFNENTSKIDAAIKAVDAKADTKAAASTVTALTQTVNQKARIAVGHYEGDGTESRFFSTGFTPKAVLVLAKDSRLVGSNSFGSDPVYGGLAVMGQSGDSSTSNIKIVSGGFNVVYKNSACSNEQGRYYNYIAFG